MTASWLLLAGSGVGAAPALAEGTQTASAAPEAPAATAPAHVAPTYTIEIPSVDAVGSSIDAATLKAIFSGDFAGHAAELAKLNATSIKVPEIDINLHAADPASNLTYVYKDIDIEGVADGVAKSASVGSGELTGGVGIDLKFGKLSAEQFDIGGLLGFYGLVPASTDQTPRTMYKNFDLASTSLHGPGFSCDVGDVSVAEFKARPLKVSLGDLMNLATSPDFQNNNPSPEAISKMVAFYADLFTAFESTPVQATKLACSGKDEQGQAIAFSMGPVSMGGFSKGRYPAVDIKNLQITQGADGKMSLSSVTFKGFDLSNPLKALQDASGQLSAEWFTQNMRKLIPAFEGFAFNGFAIDVPDPDHPGGRVNGTIGDFDLSLADYIGGIPTTVSTSSHHIAFQMPPAPVGQEDPMAALRVLGIDKLDLGFDVALHRDGAARSIVVDKVAVDGVDLGGVNLSGVLGNLDDTLFTGDQNTALAAAMGLTLKSLRLDVVDAGLGDAILTKAGAEQNMDLTTTRLAMGGLAQGKVLEALGALPQAKAVAEAVGKFVSGAKSLTVAITANDAAGLTVPDVIAGENDPAGLAGKVTIDAAAK